MQYVHVLYRTNHEHTASVGLICYAIIDKYIVALVHDTDADKDSYDEVYRGSSSADRDGLFYTILGDVISSSVATRKYFLVAAIIMVRLAHIDTPFVSTPDCLPEYC